MCQIDKREGTVSFAAIRSVLRELFSKTHGGFVRPPPLTSARVKVLTLYLVYFKVKARSQKVTRIFKSQIGHATHVSWSTFGQGIRLMCSLGRVKLLIVYSEGQVKDRSKKVKFSIL